MNDMFQYEFNIYDRFLCQNQSSWIISMKVSNDGILFFQYHPFKGRVKMRCLEGQSEASMCIEIYEVMIG